MDELGSCFQDGEEYKYGQKYFPKDVSIFIHIYHFKGKGILLTEKILY